MHHEDAHTILVKAFEYERDTTLENSPEVGRIEHLTATECSILAHVAIRALIAAGFDITQGNYAPRT